VGYYRRLFTRTWKETLSTWTIHRWWFLVAAAGATALVRFFEGVLMLGHDLLINALTGASVAFIGSLLINLIRSPVLIDRELRRQIEKVTPPSVEVERRNHVARLLSNYTDPGRECLRYILVTGHADVRTMGNHVPASGIKEVGWRKDNGGESLVIHGKPGCWAINPELKNALAFHLIRPVTPPQA
jgi:hypothetical protein